MTSHSFHLLNSSLSPVSLVSPSLLTFSISKWTCFGTYYNWNKQAALLWPYLSHLCFHPLFPSVQLIFFKELTLLWCLYFLTPNSHFGEGGEHCISQLLPQPGIEPGPLQWKPRILTIRPPGKSPNSLFFILQSTMPTFPLKLLFSRPPTRLKQPSTHSRTHGGFNT